MKFEELYNINVNDKIEERNGLKYLSWSYAVAEITKRCPDWTYKIKMFDNKPYTYDENLGYMVFTEITIDGQTKEMWLPVMDSSNKAMKKEQYSYSTKYGQKTVEPATMFDINKTIMRCLVKNIAMFGLGLYIYAGEDLPDNDNLADTILNNFQGAKILKKPTVEEVANEIIDKHYDLNVEECYSMFENRQWKDKKGQPLDWKLALHTLNMQKK